MPKQKDTDISSDLTKLSISKSDNKASSTEQGSNTTEAKHSFSALTLSSAATAVKNPKLEQASTTATTKKSKKKEVADSWEDEVSSSDEVDLSPSSLTPAPSAAGTGKERAGGKEESRAAAQKLSDKSVQTSPKKKTSASTFEEPPFFAPISPLSTTIASHGGIKQQPQQPHQQEKRQTKTDAVARRMIAGALGMKVKSTKEQREYDAAAKTAERKRIEEEKRRNLEEERERERVRKEVWGD